MLKNVYDFTKGTSSDKPLPDFILRSNNFLGKWPYWHFIENCSKLYAGEFICISTSLKYITNFIIYFVLLTCLPDELLALAYILEELLWAVLCKEARSFHDVIIGKDIFIKIFHFPL